MGVPCLGLAWLGPGLTRLGLACPGLIHTYRRINHMYWPLDTSAPRLEKPADQGLMPCFTLTLTYLWACLTSCRLAPAGFPWLAQAWPGLVWLAQAWPRLAQACSGLTWLCLAWLGLVWRGSARLTFGPFSHQVL